MTKYVYDFVEGNKDLKDPCSAARARTWPR